MHREIYTILRRELCFPSLKQCYAKNISFDLVSDLFDKTVLPILTYGCEIWGFENNDISLKLQLRFHKLLHQLKSSTPTAMVLGELCKFPVIVHIKCRMLNFWFKLVFPESQNKLSYGVYLRLYKLYSKSSHNNLYIDRIRKTLIEVGMHDLWMSQNVSSVNYELFKINVRERLQNLYIQE